MVLIFLLKKKKKTNTCKIKVLYSQQPRTHIVDISVFSKKSHLLQNHKPDAAATLLKITKKQWLLNQK